jgi:hypothetical protein
MLRPLPTLASSVGTRQAQGVEPVVRFFELSFHELHTGDWRGHVGESGFGRSGGDLHGRPLRYPQHMSGIETTDALALESLGDRLADTPRFVERRHGLPQVTPTFGYASFCATGGVQPKNCMRRVEGG